MRVIITDENDCVPEFLQSIYSKESVPETVTTATSLLQGECTYTHTLSLSHGVALTEPYTPSILPPSPLLLYWSSHVRGQRTVLFLGEDRTKLHVFSVV